MAGSRANRVIFISIVLCLQCFDVDSKRLTFDLTRNERTTEKVFRLGEDAGGDVIVPMINDKGVLYTAQIYIGTPSETFFVDLDTGSSDLWILSKGVEMANGGKTDNNNHFYDVESSTSGKSVSTTPVVIKYGSGGVTGLKTMDTVELGGVKVTDQGFMRATKVDGMNMASGERDPGTFDGIMGMGLPALAQDQYMPVIENMFQQGLIGENEKMFSFELTGQGEGSKMYVGAPVDDLMPNGMVTVNVEVTPRLNDYGYWLTKIGDVAVDGSSVCGDSGCGLGVVDTGTTFFALPDAPWQKLVPPLVAGRQDCMAMNQQGLKFYICMTANYDGLKDMSMTVAGQNYVFTPEEYTSKQKSLIGEVLIVGFLNLGEMQIDLWILGDPFLRKIYTVFDLTDPKQPKMSFAKPSDSASAAKPAVGPAHPTYFACAVRTAVRNRPLTMVVITAVAASLTGALLAWACARKKIRRAQRNMNNGGFVPLDGDDA